MYQDALLHMQKGQKDEARPLFEAILRDPLYAEGEVRLTSLFPSMVCLSRTVACILRGASLQFPICDPHYRALYADLVVWKLCCYEV